MRGICFGNLSIYACREINKAGFADSISVVNFVDIPEISKTIFPT